MERFGSRKQEHEEWHQYSEAMRERCKSDVAGNKMLFLRLTERMRQRGFTERCCEIEHKSWRLIQKQRKNGFYFNYEQAHAIFVELREKERTLKERIYVRFPPTFEKLATYTKARKKDGSPTKDFERHLELYKRVEVKPDGTYDVYGDVYFDLGSPKQRIEKLQALGWIPREFTKPSRTHPNGQPKATDSGELVPSLKEFVEESGIEEVTLLAQWMTVNNRANTINTWMTAYNENTKCIHGNLWLASTLRYRHDKPNTANAPSVKVKEWKDEDGNKHETPLRGEQGWWAYECRDLWQTRDPKNRRLVGVDAKGIQLRVLAHYLNNAAFTAAILSADPHEANKQTFGLESRSLVKTITYATLMGAGDSRIATEARVTLDEAKMAKAKFFSAIPELPALINRLKNEVKRDGRITLCDGARILVPSPHMVIPYLLQGDESRIMKQAGIYVDEGVREQQLDALKVGDIHDEWQSDVLQSHIEQFIALCHNAFSRAGISFSYNLPIECDAKIGLTWAETH
jgi:DNA polymerase-1